ncbi:MAG: CHASE3 domain-containing protein [Chthoniobacteraceae bacterium]
MQIPKAKRIYLGLLAAACCLVGVVAVSVQSAWSFRNASLMALHANEVARRIDALHSQLKDVETGQRGFVISGKASFLEPYESGMAAIPRELEALRMLSISDPSLEGRLDEIAPLVAEKIAEIQLVLDVRKSQGAQAAAEIIATGRGLRIMESLRAKLGELEAAQNAQIRVHLEHARRDGRFSGGALAVGLVFGAAMIGVVHRLVRSGEAAAAEIHDLYDRAPCGYHSLDVEGVFTAINDTELSWLGYTREELIGRVKHADLMTPESRALHHERFALFKENGSVAAIQFEVVRRDGSVMPILLNSTAIYGPDGRYASCRSTVYDNTEQVRSSRALAAAIDRLRAVNEDLEAFSYTVSHDLRAPLRHVGGFSLMLAKHLGDQADEKTQHYLKTIEGAARNMESLIEALLAFSGLGRTHLTMSGVQLDRLVAGVKAGLNGEVSGRRIEWHIAPLPEIEGDATLLRQVFTNLIGNAVKYTRSRECAHIEIGLAESGAHELVVFVRDDGAGFDPSHAKKLFGVFQRLHTAAEFEGIGVGLANVRRIVERHGGRVWAEGAVGAGATFFVSLPVRKATGA